MAQPQQAPQLTMPHPPMQHPHPQMPQMPQMPHMSQMQQQHQQQIHQMSPQITPRPTYQPVQNSPSPVNTAQPGYPMNPHKRPKVSPAPQGPSSQPNSQPSSPYMTTPYSAMSPQTHNAPPTAAHSPNYGNVQAAPSPQAYSAPYTNGSTAQMPSPASVSTPVAASSPISLPTIAPTHNLHLPEARPSQPPTPATIRPATSSLTTPLTTPMPTPQPQYTTATMAPIAPPPAPNAGTMGPPSKPAEKPVKEYEYDMTDSLAGTGVDLRAEEQALAEFYAGSFMPEARTGLPINAPGTKSSFYGAGMANQPGPAPPGKTQEEWEAECAKKAWDEAAHRMATIRSNEIRDPFCQVNVMHYKADKIAKEYGLTLNLDMKNQNPMGKMKNPHDFHDKPTIKVSTKTCEDGAIVMTTGSWIPHDAVLVDQLALLSISVKHRVRELLEEANTLAIARQTTSHGEVPAEWADVAVPLKQGVEAQTPPESAVSPRANPLKRSFEEASTEPAFVSKSAQHNVFNSTIRETNQADRKIEEARLKKRQKRLDPDKAGTGKVATAPGTPSSTAADPEQLKAPTKKESKKSLKAAAITASITSADTSQTVTQMMKGKKKWWMNKTQGGGASTPKSSGIGSPVPGSPGPGKQSNQPASLTQEGRIRLGTWREDTEKGKGIQLRDWAVVLERDGRDVKALQDAYMKLDASGPK